MASRLDIGALIGRFKTSETVSSRDLLDALQFSRISVGFAEQFVTAGCVATLTKFITSSYDEVTHVLGLWTLSTLLQTQGDLVKRHSNVGDILEAVCFAVDKHTVWTQEPDAGATVPLSTTQIEDFGLNVLFALGPLERGDLSTALQCIDTALRKMEAVNGPLSDDKLRDLMRHVPQLAPDARETHVSSMKIIVLPRLARVLSKLPPERVAEATENLAELVQSGLGSLQCSTSRQPCRKTKSCVWTCVLSLPQPAMRRMF
jgi:hypothetical protein